LEFTAYLKVDNRITGLVEPSCWFYFTSPLQQQRPGSPICNGIRRRRPLRDPPYSI